MKSHRENLEEYLRLGGSSKTAKQLSLESLQNKSRISYLLSQMKPEDPEPDEPPKVAERKGVFTDLICQYPIGLHTAFKKRYECWLEACSLKLRLNEVNSNDQEAALYLQIKILDCFDEFDKCQNALEHYKINKRIMLVESGKDFSELSPAELILKRNNIRTNITKRKKTINKKKGLLPPAGSPDFLLKSNALSQKLEELQELENIESELNKLIK